MSGGAANPEQTAAALNALNIGALISDDNHVCRYINHQLADMLQIDPEDYIGKSDQDLWLRFSGSYVRADDILALKSQMESATAAELSIEVQLATPEPTHYEISRALMDHPDCFDWALWTFTATSRVRSREKAARMESERLRLLEYAYSKLGGVLDARQITERCASVLGELVSRAGADSSAALYLAEDKQQGSLRLSAWAGIDTVQFKRVIFRGERAELVGRVAEEQILLQDRVAQMGDERRGMISRIAAPLRGFSKLHGALQVRGPDVEDRFGGKHLASFEQLCQPIIMALENAALYRETLGTAKQWSSTIDAMEDLVFLLDENNIVQAANRSLLQFLGVRNEPIVGQPAPAALKSIVEEAEGGSMRVAQLFGKNSDTPNNFIVTRSPLPEKRWILYIARDVTRLQFLEDELFHSRRMQGMGVLAGGIAHDFNNIFGGILAYSSYLEDTLKEDDPLRQDIGGIRQSAERGATLTRRLRDFSNKTPARRRAIELHKIVQDTITLMDRTLPANVEILLNLANGSPIIEADPGQIEQILMSICINAANAMDRGGTITIRTRTIKAEHPSLQQIARTPVARNYLCVTVADEGVGIPQEDLPRLFEPFYTTKTMGAGAGLDLAIAYNIIANHDGHVRVFSEEGIGSVFRIYLPESRAEVVESSQPIGDILRDATGLGAATDHSAVLIDEPEGDIEQALNETHEKSAQE